MAKDRKQSRLLTVETGILGGSLSYFKDEELVGCVVGKNDTSRAEDLVANAESLLITHGVSVNELDTIVVSQGPGSYTGLRIGISTVLGMSSATNCKTVGVPLLDSINSQYEHQRGNLIILPFGKKEFVWKFFDSREMSIDTASSPLINYYEDLGNLIEKHTDAQIICHSQIRELLPPLNENPITISGCLSSYLGYYYCKNIDLCSDLTPIYSFNPSKSNTLF